MERQVNRFDTSLPRLHRYLGERERVQRRALFTPGEIKGNVLLLNLNVLQFPNDTFPLSFNWSVVGLFGNKVQEKDCFEIVNPHNSECANFPSFFAMRQRDGKVGTIMEVVETKCVSPNVEEEEEDPWGMFRAEISLLTVGKTRFKLIEIIEQEELFDLCNVEILGDYVPSKMENYIISSSIPSFVMKSYDAINLCVQAAKLGERLLRPCNIEEGSGVVNCPTTYEETIAFSYLLSRNLPVHNATRQLLLEADSVEERLLLVIKNLQEMEETFSCRRCGEVLGTTNDVFAISDEGTAGSFVNKAGVIHQVLTLKSMDLNKVEFSGNPETTHSYFPGYSWQIMVCENCFSHLGWQFAACETNLIPANFYGLLRESISSE